MAFISQSLAIFKTIVSPKNWILQLNAQSKIELIKILFSKNRLTKKVFHYPAYLNGDDRIPEYFNELEKCFKFPPYRFFYTGEMNPRTRKGFNHEIDEIFKYGIYEYAQTTLKPSDVVLDCGANVGIFSVMAAVKIGHMGSVYAFEPGQDEIESIKKNIAVQALQNITVIQRGVWHSTAHLPFVFDHSWGNHIVEKTVVAAKNTTIQTISIDEFVSKNQLKKISFIKMDIEGAERHAIEGAQKTLQRWQPRLAISLYHNTDDYLILPAMIKKINQNYQVHIKNNVGVLMLYAS